MKSIPPCLPISRLQMLAEISITSHNPIELANSAKQLTKLFDYIYIDNIIEAILKINVYTRVVRCS